MLVTRPLRTLIPAALSPALCLLRNSVTTCKQKNLLMFTQAQARELMHAVIAHRDGIQS